MNDVDDEPLIARLQAGIDAADQLIVDLGRYWTSSRTARMHPETRRLVDYQIRHMMRQTVTHRDRLTAELKALQ